MKLIMHFGFLLKIELSSNVIQGALKWQQVDLKNYHKSDLYNFLYTQKEELFITPKYPCEIKLINILENTDLTKIDLKIFRNS